MRKLLINGAEGQNRTVDTSLFRAVLCQLSYLGTGDTITIHFPTCQDTVRRILPKQDDKSAIVPRLLFTQHRRLLRSAGVKPPDRFTDQKAEMRRYLAINGLSLGDDSHC